MAIYPLPTTQARKRFLTMVKEAGATYNQYIITYRGKPEAVLLSYEEFEGWLETLDIMQSPSWRKAVAQSKREDKAGKYLPYDQVVKAKRSRR